MSGSFLKNVRDPRSQDPAFYKLCLYAELNAQDNPLLLPIRCVRRQQLKMYKFTDRDREERIQKEDKVERLYMVDNIDKVKVWKGG